MEKFKYRMTSLKLGPSGTETVPVFPKDQEGDPDHRWELMTVNVSEGFIYWTWRREAEWSD